HRADVVVERGGGRVASMLCGATGLVTRQGLRSPQVGGRRQSSEIAHVETACADVLSPETASSACRRDVRCWHCRWLCAESATTLHGVRSTDTPGARLKDPARVIARRAKTHTRPRRDHPETGRFWRADDDRAL